VLYTYKEQWNDIYKQI